MPKVKWGFSNDEPEELSGFEPYDGPTLQVGVYDWSLKRLDMKSNRNGDDMLSGLLIANSKDPEKKRFNGAPLWFNQNLTEQGKPYLMQFLQSLGISWSEFIRAGIITEDEGRPTKVTKIAKVKFNDGNEPTLRASVKMSRATPEYPSRPEVGQFLKPKDDAGSEDWDDSDDEDGEDDDLFG